MTGTSTVGALRVVDTSFLYALFSGTDAFHERALREAKQYDSVLLPPEILSETVALIHYRQGFEAARNAGQWISAQRAFRIPASDESFAWVPWRVFRTWRGKLSYPDAVVVAWCRQLRGAPLAFDDTIELAVKSSTVPKE